LQKTLTVTAAFAAPELPAHQVFDAS
jgi:hypothetical protein